jgi:hypothetical protein
VDTADVITDVIAADMDKPSDMLVVASSRRMVVTAEIVRIKVSFVAEKPSDWVVEDV